MSSIKCLERALDILDLMYQNGGKMTLTEIANALSLYKSTVHRTLLTLEQKDFIQREEYTGVYTLGSRVFMMGLVAARSVPIAKLARPHLTYLSEKYDEYADLSVLDRGIHTSQSTASLEDFVVVFQQYRENTYSKTLITPSQCENSEVFLPAVYFCFIAFQDNITTEELKEHYQKINRRSLKRKWQFEEFLNEIQKVKEMGYSHIEGDVKTGYICIAAPIYDDSKKLVAVLSMRGSRVKLHKNIDTIVSDIIATAKLISQ